MTDGVDWPTADNTVTVDVDNLQIDDQAHRLPRTGWPQHAEPAVVEKPRDGTATEGSA